jgi:hypothetical protein
VPCGGDIARLRLPERHRGEPREYLVPLARLRAVPRDGLDVETLPFLRPSRNRLGGCRCQAFALTGDAAHTDPACALSPDRDLLVGAPSDAEVVAPEFIYRHHSAAAPDRHERFGERLPWPSVK